VPNAKIVITDNSYRLYECILNADKFVLKMSRYCHNAPLKSKHDFTQGRTCYEIHVGFVKCLWKRFCSNGNTDGYIIMMSRIAKWSWFLTWPLWDLSKWTSCKSRLFNTHYQWDGYYNCVRVILSSKSTDTAILAVQVFKITCSDLKKMTHYKIPKWEEIRSDVLLQHIIMTWKS